MEHLKTRVLHHAQSVFLREGFSKISMDEIAKTLRMSKKTIYSLFPSKNDLIWESTLSFFEMRKTEIHTIVISDQNAVKKMVLILRHITVAIKSLDAKFLEDLRHHAPDLWKQVDEFRTAFMMKHFQMVLNQGIEEGLFRKVQVAILLPIIISGLRSVITPDFLVHAEYSSKEIIASAFDFIINGICTDIGKTVFNQTVKETDL